MGTRVHQRLGGPRLRTCAQCEKGTLIKLKTNSMPRYGRINFNTDIPKVAESLPSNKKEKETPESNGRTTGRALLQSRPLNGPHGEAEVASVIRPQENAKQAR